MAERERKRERGGGLFLISVCNRNTCAQGTRTLHVCFGTTGIRLYRLNLFGTFGFLRYLPVENNFEALEMRQMKKRERSRGRRGGGRVAEAMLGREKTQQFMYGGKAFGNCVYSVCARWISRVIIFRLTECTKPSGKADLNTPAHTYDF